MKTPVILIILKTPLRKKKRSTELIMLLISNTLYYWWVNWSILISMCYKFNRWSKENLTCCAVINPPGWVAEGWGGGKTNLLGIMKTHWDKGSHWFLESDDCKIVEPIRGPGNVSRDLIVLNATLKNNYY